MEFANTAAAQAATRAGTPDTPIETVIVSPDVPDEFNGVAAEHSLIADHVPIWHIHHQARFVRNDHDYDVLGMLKPDKTKVPIYCDITAWVGK